MTIPGRRVIRRAVGIILAGSATFFSLSDSLLGQAAIDWYTVDGGGAISSTGGTFDLAGTIGQPDAASNPTLTGETFELIGGFWSVAQVCYCLGDLNHDGLKNGGDIQKFVACLLIAGDCSCADVDQMTDVTISDTDAFVADLLEDGSCP